jgi:hypothetical protein
MMKKIIGFAIEGHRPLGPILFLASQRYHENASAAGMLATHCPQFLQWWSACPGTRKLTGRFYDIATGSVRQPSWARSEESRVSQFWFRYP